MFYRLNVFPIHVPALRERLEDIPLLVEHLIERFAKQAGKAIRTIRMNTIEMLQVLRLAGQYPRTTECNRKICHSSWKGISSPLTRLGKTRASAAADYDPLATSLADQEREMIEAALAESRVAASQAHPGQPSNWGSPVRRWTPRSPACRSANCVFKSQRVNACHAASQYGLTSISTKGN